MKLFFVFGEYLSNALISWKFSVIMFSKFSSDLYQRKKKIIRIFTKELFTNTNSDRVLFLQRS